MAVITGIVASPKSDGRFTVEVDERPVATVGLETIDRLGLSIGRTYDDVREAIERDAAALHTFDRALTMLAFRARSQRELRRQLIRKGEPEEHVDAAIARLAARGLVDDAGFARQLARSGILGPGHSKRRLQAELFRKGVDRRVANEAIDAVFDDESVDAEAIIERVARRKLQSLAQLDPEARDRRLWSFLARRGYDSDDIRRAIKAVTEEWPGETDPDPGDPLKQ
jgi:regulatory protein